MGWHIIKEHLGYNFGSVATKQLAVSMLIDQQQSATETLQEYIQRFSDLLLKVQWVTTTSGKRFGPYYSFICNLHNQKLQHYLLGKTPPQLTMPSH